METGPRKTHQPQGWLEMPPGVWQKFEVVATARGEGRINVRKMVSSLEKKKKKVKCVLYDAACLLRVGPISGRVLGPLQDFSDFQC